MKRLCLIIVVAVMTFVLFTGLSSAIEFNVIINPSFEFYHPVFNDNFFLADQAIVMQLQMANNDGVDWCAYSMPLRIYGTNALTQITWVDAGGSPEPSIIRTNGFEVEGNIWNGLNDIFTWSWDGIFPDTINHSVLGCVGSSNNGWPASATELLTRLEFHFSVTLAGSDTGSVCIDSVGTHSDSRYDWLFFIPQDFGGPYCFPFANSACGDANLDGTVNILDVVFLINFKYKEGPVPTRLDLCDVNNDGSINILDIVKIINFKYKDGPALDCPPPPAAN